MKPSSLPATLAALKLNDHRIINLRQKLFYIDEVSQGSCFFLPRGARIYNKLKEYLRLEYKTRNYQEIITPNLYKCPLWKQSGHWDHYKDSMIRFSNEKGEEFSLKPMNCPGHCVLFKQGPTRSSTDLPLRWAEFGVLHRNELSGTLSGLARLRRFEQDDAHIFCTPQQVEQEVKNCLDFAASVYSQFNFKFHVKLSLRPESYLGDNASWDQAEDSLRAALTQAGLTWTEKKFEGAFYGPKIDIEVNDCQGRTHQCATIQLDFQLPERFDLQYKQDHPRQSLDGQSSHHKSRPVIIHRAILGSIERFIAMLAENCDGQWPFWLSPLQAQVIPINADHNTYAIYVSEQLRKLGLWVDCDVNDSTIRARKISAAYKMPYNLILVVGQRESETKTVNCRIDLRQMSFESSDHNDNSLRSEVTSGLELNKSSALGRVHNISISLTDLADHMVEFEKRRVNKAHIELLLNHNSIDTSCD